MTAPTVAVFGPHPILTVTIEARQGQDSDDIHVHAGGQGVWVSRMVAELGGTAVLCGFLGGEIGTALRACLAELPLTTRLVASTATSGCYVIDRRGGDRRPVATAWSGPATRHELDDLFSTTIAAALAADVLVVTNPLPGDALPEGYYRDLVSDVRRTGTPVLVDLSPPRLQDALAGRPDLVKINDWELAQYVTGPVDSPEDRESAMSTLIRDGAGSVVVTRGGAPAYAISPTGARLRLEPPVFEHGRPEGCGDSMMAGIATAWAAGESWLDSVSRGMAAGAANFLRRGLGTGMREVVDGLTVRVESEEGTAG